MTARGARWMMDTTAEGIVVIIRDRTVFQLLAWNFWLDEDTRDSIRLVVSELVTNAIVHGRSPYRAPIIEIGIIARRGEVYIEVSDPSDEMPVVRPVDDEREGGRGLLLVECMALKWGAERLPHGGKRVWTLLRIPPRPSALRRHRPDREARQRHRAQLQAQLYANWPLTPIDSRPLAMAT